ncbi:MAG: type II toxin-antitoxin system RelB/DinJ family antitoxin [Inquilinus sp.]|uniref:type II toxin-antitoxin system RelB/DinJ family antitoxin n=1 Tax=Inquilinus sp. TaxID=1932117 RepID=UPI003F37417E
MLDSALVQTRIDPALTDKASLMLAQMGLTVSDAVRMLLTRVANDGTPGRARRRSSDL